MTDPDVINAHGLGVAYEPIPAPAQTMVPYDLMREQSRLRWRAECEVSALRTACWAKDREIARLKRWRWWIAAAALIVAAVGVAL